MPHRIGFLFLLLIASAPCIAGSVRASADEHAGHATAELGVVHMAITCRPVQADFDRALAMLHSFWYEQAQQNFAAIAKSDPACAMAWWGLAMTYWHPLWDRPDASALAQARKALVNAGSAPQTSPREQAFVNALTSFYTGDGDYLARTSTYETAMADVYAAYPADAEAATFYALALLASAQALPTDKSFAREKQAAQLLNAVLGREQQHPGALHYLIHAYDSPPLAYLALNAARTYARIAPAVPHAQHMPSHIFVRLGLWQEAISSNQGAENAAKHFATEMHLPGAWDEQLHAMDYLEYAHLQRGADTQAGTVLRNLRAIERTSPQNFKVAYAYAAIPARHAIEREQWSEAAALVQEHPDFPWAHFPWAQAITEFARGMGAARAGDVTKAQAAASRLQELQIAIDRGGDHYWATQVQIQQLAVSAWLAHAQRDDASALKHMRQAADLEDASEKRPVTPGPVVPARELLGTMLLELKQPAKALTAFQTALASAPNRFNAVVGAARAALASGDVKAAQKYYADLLAIAAADAQRPALQEARDFLGKSQGSTTRTD